MKTLRGLTMIPILLVATLITAQPAHAGGAPIADASRRAAGLTAGQLIGEEMRQLLTIAPDVNPLAGQGGSEQKCLSTGRRSKVLIVWTTPEAQVSPTECHVKPGTPLFFSTLFAECSSVEDPPFFGATAEEQRACALAFLNDPLLFDEILVQIDDQPAVNIGLPKYLATSGQVSVDLPDPNILRVPDRHATFVAAAYSATLKPLPPGTHSITVTIVGGQFPGVSRATVHVEPGQHR